MGGEVYFREIHNVKRSTVIALAAIFTMSGLPLTLFSVWGGQFDPVVFAIGIAAIVVPTVGFSRLRWEVAVREDGVYMRTIPFRPYWRHVVDANAVETASVDTISPSNLGIGAIFGLGSSDVRIYCANDEAKPRGTRIVRQEKQDAFFGSDSPDKFADAITTLASD